MVVGMKFYASVDMSVRMMQGAFVGGSETVEKKVQL